MTTATKQSSPVVATAQTKDGYIVNMHLDGTFSNRANFYGKIKIQDGFMVLMSLCGYEEKNVLARLRAAVKGGAK